MWQAAIVVVVAAAPVAAMSVTAPMTHCHAGAHQHTGTSDCCQTAATCHCQCDLGSAALPVPALRQAVAATHSPVFDLRSPPDLRGTAEVFRPPI
jgi:hypothetical protein